MTRSPMHRLRIAMLVASLVSPVLVSTSCEGPTPRRRHGQPTAGVDAAVQQTDVPPPAPTLPANAAPPGVKVQADMPPQWLGRPLGPSRLADPADAALPVARVGNKQVTLGDVDLQLRGLPGPAVAQLGTEQGRKAFADSVLGFLLMADEAERRGLLSDPTVRFAELVARATAARQQVFDERAPASVTDDEVKAFYEANKSRYASPEQRYGALLVVATEQEAHKLKQEIEREAATAGPARMPAFTARARQLSLEQVSKKRGGGLPPAQLDADPLRLERPLTPDLVKRLFEMEAFGLSDPFEFQFKWALLTLVSITPARDIPLEEAAPAIRRSLAARRGPSMFDEALNGWRTTYAPTTDLTPFDHVKVIAEKGGTDTLQIDPAHAGDVVVKTADVTIDLATAAQALEQLPVVDQQSVVDGQRREGFERQLVDLAVLAQAAFELGVADSPIVRQAAQRQAVHVLEQQVKSGAEKVEVTEDDVRAAYDANATAYHRPERRRIQYVEFSSEQAARKFRSDLETGIPEASSERGEMMYSQLKPYEGSKVVGGGTYPYVGLEEDGAADVTGNQVAVPDGVRKAAFAMEMYELSEPILVDGAWNVIMVDAIRPPAEVPYGQAAAALRLSLTHAPGERALRVLQDQLRAAAQTEVFADALEHLTLPDTPPVHAH